MGIDYKYLKERGALNEGTAVTRIAPAPAGQPAALFDRVPPAVIELMPESVARENLVFPLAFDGETLTVAAVNHQDIALADRLRFILAKNVRLVPASRPDIVNAIKRYYRDTETESVDSLLQEFDEQELCDSAVDATVPEQATAAPAQARVMLAKQLGTSLGGLKSLLAIVYWFTLNWK